LKLLETHASKSNSTLSWTKAIYLRQKSIGIDFRKGFELGVCPLIPIGAHIPKVDAP